MDKAELDAFLTKERTCRVATVNQHGPHLTPLWHVWDGDGRHAWLRLEPEKITSWDFRKLYQTPKAAS
jgi:nitroimidazol reductase NimA-like FMN-containing flavoprotein (pyridoxamine 5'-phosphate oxidase superfamily)